MLKQQKRSDSNLQIADRRATPRVPIRSVAYVELDNDNGGLILNVSEGGIGVQSAEMIVGERFSRIRFRLPKSEQWIESEGKLVWLGKSRKEAGIRFVNLGDEARQQIQKWIYSATFGSGIPADQGHFKIVWESEAPKPATQEAAAGGASEISSMFPSEKVVPPKRRAGVDIHLNGHLNGHPNEHVNDSGNDASPLDVGIAPGPVKRIISPSGSQAPHAGLTDLPPETPAAPTAAPTEPPSFARRAYNYPSATVLPRDPFASIAADGELPPQVTPPLSPPPEFNSSRAADRSAYELREHYRGLGYQPQPFEEPSGKGWYFVAAIVVVVLLGVGAVLALGPANVKSLLAEHLPASIVSSNPAPPPPYDSLQESPAPAAPSSQAKRDDVPFGSAAEGPIVNPGISTPPPQSAPTKAGPTHSANEPAASAAAPPEHTNSSEAVPSEAVPNSEQTESAENAAEITRRFQMEHSTASVATPPPSSSSQTSVSQKPAPAFRNEGTEDAYPEPAPAPSTPRSTSTPTAPATNPNSAPQPSAGPAGTVAVSSHFYALRAEDPQTTLARQGLAIGQLISIHQPVYPVEAERAHVEGAVQLRLTIDQTGKVEIVHAISGPPMLVPAAIEAVRQWRYAATTVEGKAQESVDDVNIVFRLGNSAASPR